MEFLQPVSWDEALAEKAENPSVPPIPGGTDVTVELSCDRHRPAALSDLNRISELTEWESRTSAVRTARWSTARRSDWARPYRTRCSRQDTTFNARTSHGHGRLTGPPG